MGKKTTKKLTLKDRDISAKKAQEIKGGAGGMNVLMCDGSVRSISASLNLKQGATGITDGTSN